MFSLRPTTPSPPSWQAKAQGGESGGQLVQIEVDQQLVRNRLEDLLKTQDLSKFIL